MKLPIKRTVFLLGLVTSQFVFCLNAAIVEVFDYFENYDTFRDTWRMPSGPTTICPTVVSDELGTYYQYNPVQTYSDISPLEPVHIFREGSYVKYDDSKFKSVYDRINIPDSTQLFSLQWTIIYTPNFPENFVNGQCVPAIARDQWASISTTASITHHTIDQLRLVAIPEPEEYFAAVCLGTLTFGVLYRRKHSEVSRLSEESSTVE